MPPALQSRAAQVPEAEHALLHDHIDELTFGPRGPAGELPRAFDPTLRRHLLVGVGDDPASSWACAWAVAWARIFPSRATLLHVRPPMTTQPALWGAPIVARPEIREEELEAGWRLLDREAERLRRAGLDVGLRQTEGPPAREIGRVGEEADLVLVGCPAQNPVQRLVVGSVADGVKNHADTDVLLAKSPPEPGDVLCPVDGSWMSKRAASVAFHVARGWGTTLHVVHALPPPYHIPFADTARYLVSLEKGLKLPWSDLPGVHFSLVVGDPGEALVRVAGRLGVSLVVMGNRGYGAVRSLFLGSVTNHVAHHVEQSLLLVKPPRER